MRVTNCYVTYTAKLSRNVDKNFECRFRAGSIQSTNSNQRSTTEMGKNQLSVTVKTASD